MLYYFQFKVKFIDHFPHWLSSDRWASPKTIGLPKQYNRAPITQTPIT